MVELEESPLIAALPVDAHERALPAIPLPHRATNIGRDVALAHPRSGASGSRRDSNLSPFELLNESVQGSVQDLVDVARRKGVAQERLCVPKLGS